MEEIGRAKAHEEPWWLPSKLSIREWIVRSLEPREKLTLCWGNRLGSCSDPSQFVARVISVNAKRGGKVRDSDTIDSQSCAMGVGKTMLAVKGFTIECDESFIALDDVRGEFGKKRTREDGSVVVVHESSEARVVGVTAMKRKHGTEMIVPGDEDRHRMVIHLLAQGVDTTLYKHLRFVPIMFYATDEIVRPTLFSNVSLESKEIVRVGATAAIAEAYISARAAEILRRGVSPLFLDMYDFFTHKNCFFMVMERVDNSVKNWLTAVDGDALTFRHFASFIVQFLVMLTVADEVMGLKHHDLHLKNVFIRRLKDEFEYGGFKWNDCSKINVPVRKYHRSLAAEVVKGSKTKKKKKVKDDDDEFDYLIIPNCGFLIALADFGFASIDMPVNEKDRHCRFGRCDMSIFGRGEEELRGLAKCATESKGKIESKHDFGEWGPYCHRKKNMEGYDLQFFFYELMCVMERKSAPRDSARLAKLCFQLSMADKERLTERGRPSSIEQTSSIRAEAVLRFLADGPLRHLVHGKPAEGAPFLWNPDKARRFPSLVPVKVEPKRTTVVRIVK